MKVLLIDPRLTGSNFSLDSLWSGLIDVLGWRSVLDFPSIPRHRSPFPVWDDADPEGSYQRERFSLGFHEDAHLIPRLDLDAVDDLVCRGEVERVILDERPASFELYRETMLDIWKVPVTVVAAHDRFENDMPTLRRWYGADADVRVLSSHPVEGTERYDGYLASFDHLWPIHRRQDFLADKRWDCSFLGGSPGLGDRRPFVEHLKKRFPTCPVLLDGRMPRAGYLETIARSRVAVCLRGDNATGLSLRHVEVPYVGSWMLTQTFDESNLAHPFEDCGRFTTLEELDRRLDWALSCPLEREAQARRAHLHAFRHRSARAGAEQVLDLPPQGALDLPAHGSGPPSSRKG